MPRSVTKNKKPILFALLLLALIIGGTVSYFYFNQIKQGIQTIGEEFKEFFAVSETKYGEKLVIRVRVGLNQQKETASWFASWYINGTDKGDDLISVNMEISVTVDISGQYITNVQIDSCTVDCQVTQGGSGSYSYPIGSTPAPVTLTDYQGSWSDFYSTDVDAHLGADLALDTAPTSDVTYIVEYYLSVTVSAEGENSGNPLTAEITSQKFAMVNYTYALPPEELNAEASGSITFTSWFTWQNITNCVIVGLTVIVVVLILKGGKKHER